MPDDMTTEAGINVDLEPNDEVSLEAFFGLLHSRVDDFRAFWLKNLSEHPNTFDPEMSDEDWMDQFSDFVDLRRAGAV